MEKQLYVFKDLYIVNNIIAIDVTKIHENEPNTVQRFVLSFTKNGGVYENYEQLIHDIELYTKDISNPHERYKILECVLYIASMQTKNPTFNYNGFEHILYYSKYGERETYFLKGFRYPDHSTISCSRYPYRYILENRIAMQIEYMCKYMFGEKCNDACEEQQIKKENNMEIFISKKKKDGSLYLVFKSHGKTKDIKIPNELKKAFEKSASVKTIDGKVISLLPNKIYLFGRSGNLKLDREEGKSIIRSWLPEEKYRKMLFISFILLQIKIKFNHISIDKDIFERFKLTETKASYEKLYDIVDLLTKIKFGKNAYDCAKNDFSLK